LSRLAREARARGEDFDTFWWRALRVGESLVTRYDRNPPDDCVIWPRDTWDRRNDMEAILSTEGAWRRAYEHIKPKPCEAALAILSPAAENLPVSGFTPAADVRSARERDHAVAA